MGFLKQFAKDEIVFVINDEIIDNSLVKKIIENIEPNYKIGLDMKNVKALRSPLFIEYLNKEKYKLYNLRNEIMTYLSLIIKNGRLRSFMNYKDFNENKRELVRRRFIIVS